MDFLKSTLSAAISKGPPFPYTFHDRIGDPSIWTLYNGTQQSTGTPCSIFTFELNPSGGQNQASLFPLARNAVKKWRTLRHPGVVKFLDSVETDTYIYIATERVRPLGDHVQRGALGAETIKWGLWNIAITLKFINVDAACIHGNVKVQSVFMGEGGEWKLAGFEVLSSVKDDEPFIYRYGGLLPDAGRSAAPEIGKGGWDGLRSQPVHVTDSWGFAILMHETFNGSFGIDQLASPKKIPGPMTASYKRLIAANPKSRLSVAHFLEQGIRANSFFDTPLIHVSEFVENMGTKSQTEREEFLDLLERTGDQFPEDFFKMKVLPELLKSVEFGYGGPKVFNVVLQIGDKLTEEEWDKSITPALIRLFALPDRATRVFLLENLSRMIDHLSKQVVTNKIFPEMLTGFSDGAPIVREQTVKAVLIVAPKLSDRILNGDLLRHLARTQNDEQPGIRTNTTICLGKIAQYLGKNTRQKVLIAAFSRSLRDPFVHARNAALLALSATSEIFDETDCASRVVPAISPSLVDKEKDVRIQAQKTLDLYLTRIRTLTASYPDHEAAAPEIALPAAFPAAIAAAVPQGEAAGWAGWAISSFTKSLASAAVEGDIRTKTPVPQAAPTAVASAPVTVSTTPVPAKQQSSFLPDNEDDDDMQGWDSPAEEEEQGEPETFFDAPVRAPVRMADAVPGGKVSSFGPKPFTLHPKKTVKKELDFESMAGTRKPAAPLRAQSTPVAKKVPVAKKAPAKKQEPVKKQEPASLMVGGDGDDDDWGEDWGT